MLQDSEEFLSLGSAISGRAGKGKKKAFLVDLINYWS